MLRVARDGVTTAPPVPDRVLLIDDEADLRKLLVYNLEEAGFVTEAAGTGTQGLAAAALSKPTLVILDLMLPDLSGTEVCRRLRADPALADVGILMLTARRDEYDRVLGFEVGADDYVVKPFSVRELVMRVRALARRCGERRVARQAADVGRRLSWRGLVVDPVRHRAHADGVELGLRPLEFRLFLLFLEQPTRTFTRSELLAEVWGITGESNTRTVYTHVMRLRASLGSYGEAIETVHGAGYRLRQP